MRCIRLRSSGGMVVGILSCAGVLLAAEANLPGPDSTAAELVNAALSSELKGPSAVRGALLKQALDRDPNYAPARWQSGFVRYDNQWLTLEEVTRRVSGDEQLAEYRKRRDALIDRADDHRALAQWCHKHKLADLERIHWAKVLEFNANDTEALAALRLQLYEGRLLTSKQVEAAKLRAGELRHALELWRPRMTRWRKKLDSGNEREQSAAREELNSIDDPQAIAPLENVFAEDIETEKNDAANLVLIETVGRMQCPEATQVLLRRALKSDSQKVRYAACGQLKIRPAFAFVPQLIVMVPEEFEARARFEVYLSDQGATVFQDVVEYRNPNTVRTVVTDTAFYSRILGWNVRFPVSDTTRMGESERLEMKVRQELELQRRSREHAIERVREVLARTTDLKTDRGPDAWQKAWDSYSEAYRSQFYGGPIRETEYRVNVRTLSCFPAGTPVLTMTGMLPIEKIKIGDRVLSQNPATGELAYKSVQGATLRPAVPLVQIHTGSQCVSATRGHPFWANGEGWLMAKQLKVGQVLHGFDGAVMVDAIEEAPAQQAYNLLVSDFGTYFVGENHLLVHDNLPLAETSALVPGLSVPADSP